MDRREPAAHRLWAQIAIAVCVMAAAGLVIGTSPAEASVRETFARSAAGSQQKVDHGAWDKLLKTYVVVSSDGINRVNYVRFQKEGRGDLKTYIKSLEAIDVGALRPAEQMAFWINLYNAATADVVLDKYPVKSIRDISLPDPTGAPADGPWKAKLVKVSNVALSLDEIENEILRPIFKDGRVHYALNCLSIGCPNLLNEAYTGANLDAQLDAAARAFVNHPRGISFEGGKVRACSIYEWFTDDFGGDLAGVLAHMRQYAEPALRQKLDEVREISEYHYDWTLNDTQG